MRARAAILSACIIAFSWAVALAAEQSSVQLVTLHSILKNKNERAACDAVLYTGMPRDFGSQEVLRLVQQPKPNAVIKEKWGQELAVYKFPKMPPGSVRQVTTVVWVRWKQMPALTPDAVGTLKKIPSNIKKYYLSDSEKYRIHDPFIKETAARVTAGTSALYTQAKKIHEYVTGHVVYDLAGGWDDAPTVLKRGSGSCSEYSFAMIALYRAVGIPARYVGGTVRRSRKSVSADLWNHRWTQIYLPGYGWTPLDLKPGAFAKWYPNRLVLVVGNGAGHGKLGWSYTARTAAKGGKLYHRTRAYWSPSKSPAEEYRAAAELLRALSGTRRRRQNAISMLFAARPGYAVPFIQNALFSEHEQVRAAAVEALRKIGGQAAETALVDCIELVDPTTQAAMVTALRGMTGEDITDPHTWRKWLASRHALKSIRVKACIAGKAELILTRSEARWCKTGGSAAPLTQPACIDGVEWTPEWPPGQTCSTAFKKKSLIPSGDLDVETKVTSGKVKVSGKAQQDGSVRVTFENPSPQPEWCDVLIRFRRPL